MLQDPQSRAICICIFIQNNAGCAVHGSGKGGGGTAAVNFFGLPWSPGIAARNCDTTAVGTCCYVNFSNQKKLWCRVPVLPVVLMLVTRPLQILQEYKIGTDFRVFVRHSYPPTGISTGWDVCGAVRCLEVECHDHSEPKLETSAPQRAKGSILCAAEPAVFYRYRVCVVFLAVYTSCFLWPATVAHTLDFDDGGGIHTR